MHEAYRFCPRCGAAKGRAGEIPFRCDACGLAIFFGPVAAVAALIVNPKGELLMVRRACDPGAGLWGLPGGFVDQGETAEQAVAREIREETGLTMTSAEPLLNCPNLYAHDGVTAAVLDLFYRCEVDPVDEIVLEKSELDRFEWTRPDARRLDAMAFPSNRFAVETWLQASS